MQLSLSSFLLGLSTLAAAYTTPTSDPSGNAITKPGLNELVPAGQPYTITWDPTTEGTVSLVLLRGPSTNVQPLYAIAEGIANSGTYTWTPSTDLEPDTTHYGLELIVDSTGQYQYSTQFGISNDAYTGGSSSSSAASASASSSPSSIASASSAAVSTTLVTSVSSSAASPVATVVDADVSATSSTPSSSGAAVTTSASATSVAGSAAQSTSTSAGYTVPSGTIGGAGVSTSNSSANSTSTSSTVTDAAGMSSKVGGLLFVTLLFMFGIAI